MEASEQQSVRGAFEQLPWQIVLVDDWKRVSSHDERRRIQNRINQRATRKRKRTSSKCSELKSKQVIKHQSSTGHSRIHRLRGKGAATAEFQSQPPSLWQALSCAIGTGTGDCSRAIKLVKKHAPASVDVKMILSDFEIWRSNVTGSPGRDCLLALVQFNILRAVVSNARGLGLPDGYVLDDDAVSMFSNQSVMLQDMPRSLRPTRLQTEIEHHPWIDLLPSAKMRDNLIQATDKYDEDELCNALLGFSPNSKGKTGMVVWAEAWSPTAWEFTEEFIHCWGWTVQGCDDLLESTNRWRQARGKKPLTLTAVI